MKKIFWFSNICLLTYHCRSESLELAWTECVGGCSDGARFISCYCGALIRSQAKYPICLRYSIWVPHWTKCSNVVNFIRTPSEGKVFQKTKNCKDMGVNHSSLLYYNGAWCFSRCNVLSHTFKLRQEIYIFLKNEIHKDVDDFADVDFFICS